MSYTNKETAITRCPVSLTVIKQDYCQNTFSVSPCTAIGTPCYNTYKTCIDKPNYIKTIKNYDHVNNDAPRGATFQELNARPDLLSVEFIGTELREDKTIPARATFTFQDDNDYDQGIDPYRSTRTPNLLNVKGSYWKKWIERNPYYKGRVLEHWQGYSGITKSEFELKFSGKMENITREGNTVKIECVDDIVDLANQKYPFKTSKKIAEDTGACTECKSQEDMLKLTARENDLALRIDFKYLSSPTTELLDNPSSTLNGTYYYTIVGYDVNNNAYEMCAMETFITGVDRNSVRYTINPDNAHHYRIYRTHNGETFYLQTSNLIIEDYGQSLFTTPGEIPTLAVRYFKFTGSDSFDLNNWTELITPLTLLLDNVTDLDTTGYIKVDEEIIYYNGITSLTLQNVARLRYKTKAETPHYEGTNIKLVTWKAPGNPFTILEDLWLDTGIPAGRIDSTTLGALAAAWTGINVSTKPIIKDTDGAKLTADLAWAMDTKYWVNEEGKLTVRRNDDETVDHVITDAENIVLDSQSVDFNQDEIYTRILLYTNRNDVTKSGTDNYSDIYVEVYANAEGPNMFDKEIPLTKETTWINDDCGTPGDISSYVSNLLNKKLKRLVAQRPKLSFDVELQDNKIKVGQVVQLSCNAFNDINGNDYSGKKAEVLKKEPKGARIKLLVRLIAVEEITTVSDNQIRIFENPLPVKSFSLREVAVTGLSYIDTNDVRQYTVANGLVDVENFLIPVWNNMYMSEATTATDINGVTRSLPLLQAWAGFPPYMSPIGDPYPDTSSWKTTKKYNFYIIILNEGQTQSAVGRPSANDANGIWYLAAVIPDTKINDAAKFYKLKYQLPTSMLGRNIGFAVYADANLVFDPNAPAGIEIGRLL